MAVGAAFFLGTVRTPYSNTRRSGTYSVAFYPAGGIGRRTIDSSVGGETLELDIKMFFSEVSRAMVGQQHCRVTDLTLHV